MDDHSSSEERERVVGILMPLGFPPTWPFNSMST